MGLIELLTRAIIMMREGKKDQSMEVYRLAWEGMPVDRVLRAKLQFNMGIGYVKIDQIEQAMQCFAESVRLGGVDFGRAQRPLQITKNAVQAKKKTAALSQEEHKWTNELEWERV